MEAKLGARLQCLFEWMLVAINDTPDFIIRQAIMFGFSGQFTGIIGNEFWLWLTFFPTYFHLGMDTQIVGHILEIGITARAVIFADNKHQAMGRTPPPRSIKRGGDVICTTLFISRQSSVLR